MMATLLIAAYVDQHDLRVFVIRADEEYGLFLAALGTLLSLSRHRGVHGILRVDDDILVFFLELSPRYQVVDDRGGVFYYRLVAAALDRALVRQAAALVFRIQHVVALRTEPNALVLGVLVETDVVVFKQIAHLYYSRRRLYQFDVN